MKRNFVISLMALSAACAMGDVRFDLLAHTVTDSSASGVLASPRFMASVSLHQEFISGRTTSDRFVVDIGFEAAVEGFAPDYDGSVDSTGNGIPDLWEIRYFGGIGLAPPTLTKQGREVDTRTVYFWGVDPFDTDAVLEAYQPVIDEDAFTMFFDSARGRLYQVWATSNLLDAEGWEPLASDIAGTGESVAVQIDEGEPFDRRYYRIEVRVAPP